MGKHKHHNKNSCCGHSSHHEKSGCCHSGHFHGFRRKFFTAEERINELKDYKEMLQQEIKGVEEKIEKIKSC